MAKDHRHFDYAEWKAKQAAARAQRPSDFVRKIFAVAEPSVPKKAQPIDEKAVYAAMVEAWQQGSHDPLGDLARSVFEIGAVAPEVPDGARQLVSGFSSPTLPPPMDAPCLSRQKVQRQVAAAKQAIVAQHPAVLERATGTAAVLVMTPEDLAALLGFPRGEARLAFDLRLDAISIVVKHPDMPMVEVGEEMPRIPVGKLGDR